MVELLGYKLTAIKDAEGDNVILDLKYTKNANPDDFFSDFLKYGYDFQAGVYTYDSTKKYFVLAFDKYFNFSVIEVGYDLLMYGQEKLEYCLNMMDHCIENNCWNESYNFHSRVDSKLITFVKPKWAKSYRI